MCPACISAATLAVVGTTSAGGLVALLARMLRLKKGAMKADVVRTRHPLPSASRSPG